MQKNIAILGSTGSIGCQALNVIRRHRDRYTVEVLCAGSNSDRLIEQALEFEPNAVAIADEQAYGKVQEALRGKGIKVLAGEEAVADLMTMGTIDLVLSAIVGFAGLKPTIAAIEAGKPVALANKETMVVAGQVVTTLAAKNKVPILPVDSEHSAIFQCLVGELSAIDKILLTASGGPFYGKTIGELAKVSPADALKHPIGTWGRRLLWILQPL